MPQNPAYSQYVSEELPVSVIKDYQVLYYSMLINMTNDSIQKLPDDAFVDSKKASEFKNNFSHILMEGEESVNDLILRTNWNEYPLEENLFNMVKSVSILNDLSKKLDGSLGGNPNDDWITDPDAQKQIASRIGYTLFEFTDGSSISSFILTARNIQGDPYIIWGHSEHVTPSTFTIIPNKSILFDIWGEGKIQFHLPHSLIQEVYSIKAENQPIEFETLSSDSITIIEFIVPSNKTSLEIAGNGIPHESFDVTRKNSDHKCRNHEIKPSLNEKPLDIIWIGSSTQRDTSCDAVVHLQSLNYNVEKRERPLDNLDDANLVIINLKSNTDQFIGNVTKKLSDFVTNGGKLIILADKNFRNCDWYSGKRCEEITADFGFRFGSLNSVLQIPLISKTISSTHAVWNEPNEINLDNDWCCDEFVEIKLVDNSAEILGEYRTLLTPHATYFDGDFCCDNKIFLVLHNHPNNKGRVVGIDYNNFIGKFGNFDMLENIVRYMISDENNSYESSIPNGIKDSVRWWTENQIDDETFYYIIEYLTGNDMVLEQNVPGLEYIIPKWLKNNSDWWTKGLISDQDFIDGIKYLKDQRIIRVN
jgi:hypothetical protein